MHKLPSSIHPKVKWPALAGLIVACATFLGLPVTDGEAATLTAVVSAVVGWFVGGSNPAPDGAQDDGADVESK